MQKGRLRIVEGNRLAFWCPACAEGHCIILGRWTFNGNYDRPSFQPSVLVTSGHYVAGHTGECWCSYNAKHKDSPAPFACCRCHFYVTKGQIEYLPDSTHSYAGRTVELEEF